MRRTLLNLQGSVSTFRMSLWTPYSEEGALDLSLATAVKSERASPVPERLTTFDPHHGFPGYTCRRYSVSPAQDRLIPGRQPTYCINYPYPEQTSCPVPLVQMSPDSSGSYCSAGYEASVAAASISPSYLSAAHHDLAPSPPDTPESLKDHSRHRTSGKHHLLDLEPISNDPEFQAFERDALRAMAEKNGGSLLGNNPRMRRAVRSTNQNPSDDSYREQRERNNHAAKQSRDRRKLREVRLALEVTYLSKQVAKLKAKLAAGLCDRCHV